MISFMEVAMFIMRTIIIVLAIAAVTEGMLIRRMFCAYQKQILKVELLTKIIEERLSKHGKDFDNG